MAVQSCPTRITCPDCLDFPIQNFSSEDADAPVFLGMWHFRDPPPHGWRYNRLGCLSLCESTVSQAVADQCAHDQAQLCAEDGDACSGGLCGDWERPVPGDGYEPVVMFSSAGTTVQRSCPSPPGGIWTYTVPGGLASSPVSQATADAIGLSIAQARASVRSFCPDPPKACLSSEDPYAFQITTLLFGAVQALGTFEIVSGALPPGFSLSPAGLLSGTPVATGSSTFTVRATEFGGSFLERDITLTVVEILPEVLPDADEGVAYSQTLSLSGGTDPVSWQLSEGALPPGLTLDPLTGEISGIPEADPTPPEGDIYEFTVSAQDGTSSVCSREYTMATNALQWTISPGAGRSGTGIGGACTGTVDQISVSGFLQFAVNANTNNVRNNFPCLGPCGVQGLSATFDSAVVGPFAEPRNVTVSGTAELQNADFLDFLDSGGCVHVPASFASSLLVRINDLALGTVAEQNESCTAAESPKPIVVSLTYLLPAGNTFAIFGVINAWGAFKTSSINISVSAVPA